MAESDRKERMDGRCASLTLLDNVTLSSMPNNRNSFAVRKPRSGTRSSSLPAPDILFNRGSSPKNKYSKFLLPMYKCILKKKQGANIVEKNLKKLVLLFGFLLKV